MTRGFAPQAVHPVRKVRATVLLLQTLYKPQHRMATIVILLAFVGTLSVAMEASAQTVAPRLGTPPFARDGLSRETTPTLYDAPDVQRPVGFEPQDRRGLDRFHNKGTGSELRRRVFWSRPR